MKPMWWVDRILSDDRLRADEKALLLWLGRKSRAWRYSVDEAAQAMHFERKKYQRTLARLKAIGWVVTSHKRDRLGRIKFTKILVRDVASPEGAKSTLGKAFTGRCKMKPSGPEGANCTQTSLKNLTPGIGQAQTLRVIGGGRCA